MKPNNIDHYFTEFIETLIMTAYINNKELFEAASNDLDYLKNVSQLHWPDFRERMSRHIFYAKFNFKTDEQKILLAEVEKIIEDYEKLFAEEPIDYDDDLEDGPTEHSIISGNSLLNMPIKENPFVIEKMIPEGAITALTADSGKGKSILMLILVKHVATGEKLFDKFGVKQKNVLILDLEMDEDIIASRYQALINCEMPIYYYHNQLFDINNESDFEFLVKQIKKNDLGLIVFDTISNIHTKEENSAAEMKEVNKKLLRLIQLTGVTIIYLHHHRKKGKDEKYTQGSSRGSTEIIAKVASHLLLDSKSTEDDMGNMVLKVTLEQFKSRRPESLTKIGIDIIYNPETKKSSYVYTGEADDKKQSVKDAKEFIIDSIAINTEYTVKDLVAEKTKLELAFGENSIREACKELLKDGTLDSHKGIGTEWNKDYFFKKV